MRTISEKSACLRRVELLDSYGDLPFFEAPQPGVKEHESEQARYGLETARDEWASRIHSEVRPRSAA